MGLAAGLPARGQITLYLDEGGKRIYMNDGPSQPATAKVHAPVRGNASTRRAPRGLADRPAQSSKPQLEQLVMVTAERHRLDPALVRAVIEAESGWNPAAVSSKGAQGLMQLLPVTAMRFGVGDPFDPAQNVEGGARYLAALLDRYEGDLMKSLAAYYAGEGAVDRAARVPDHPEVRAYVRRIAGSYLRMSSGSGPIVRPVPQAIYRTMDQRGRVVYTNQ